MKIGMWTMALALLLTPVASWAEEYPIGNPGQALSAPVHTTQPVQGAVEVTNLPPVQEVHVSGGRLDEPLEVRGEVGLRISAPLPVEVVNPKASMGALILGPLKVDDTQPVRVWVENPWNPENPSAPEFTGFVLQRRFLPQSGEDRFRGTFAARPGRIFYLTDVVADIRPDTSLKVRVLAGPKSVGGSVAGVEFAEFPVAVLDGRRASTVRLGTPVPLTGEFVVEVEVVGAVQGGYFTATAMGYLAPLP
ncbi:MAG: hypothetical protein HZB55_02165 [Deltaproteobacteria bacterium]|nr:hypothetical protein [Deltaproteobacteria bacterium]